MSDNTTPKVPIKRVTNFRHRWEPGPSLIGTVCKYCGLHRTYADAHHFNYKDLVTGVSKRIRKSAPPPCVPKPWDARRTKRKPRPGELVR
jgi:hypothetical protein